MKLCASIADRPRKLLKACALFKVTAGTATQRAGRHPVAGAGYCPELHGCVELDAVVVRGSTAAVTDLLAALPPRTPDVPAPPLAAAS